MPSEPRIERFQTLDGARGMAAICVMLFHFSANGLATSTLFPNAFAAVDYFFCLSGFVLSFTYDQRLRDGMTAGNFMTRRLVRLYPMYFMGLLLGVAAEFLVPSTSWGWRQILLAASMSLFFLPTLSPFSVRNGELTIGDSHHYGSTLEPFDRADVDEAMTISANATAIPAHLWQHRDAVDANDVFSSDQRNNTKVVDGACIFLNRPGFDGGIGCAFHHLAAETGERKMDLQPDVCWQLPLRLEEHTDDHGYVTSTLREWKRRDWGPGGQEFHWWCIDDQATFEGQEPVYVYLRNEITEMIGKKVYQRLVELLERPNWTPLPHPVTRRASSGRA